jgi:hypothetical protein
MALMGSIDLPLAAVREQVLGALDLLVRVVRGATGARLVAEVAEVVSGPGHAVATRPLAVGRRCVAHPTRPARRPDVAVWASGSHGGTSDAADAAERPAIREGT